jgi:tetratricopeptide (TPR) repeat protein
LQFDIDKIQKEQTKLSFLKDSDLNSLVLFSDYDVYLDKKLYYNKEVRELIQKIDNANSKVEQTNVTVAYNTFKDIINTMVPNDFYYMLIAYKLTEHGFFSLSYLAMNKVQDKEIWGNHISALKKYYFPSTFFNTTEEVFLAGLYEDIIYNNLPEESLKKISKSGTKIENSDYGNFIKAKAYYAQKDFDNALTEINKSLANNRDNLIYIKLKAEILIQMNREKDALTVIKPALILKNPIVDAKKDFDKIKYFAMAKNEKNEILQKYYLACYFYLNQDYERAIKELNILILKGEHEKVYDLMGKIYLVTEKYSDADRIYKKAISAEKKPYYAYKGLGDLYLKRRQYNEALEKYKLAEKGLNKDIETIIALTISNFNKKDYKMAYKYLNKAQKIAPDNYKVLYLSSQLQKDLGKQYLVTSISQNIFYPEGWLDMARDAINLKDISSAEKYINAAAFITKKSPRYFYFKSILNTEKKSYEDAEIDINRAKELLKEQEITDKSIEEI